MLIDLYKSLKRRFTFYQTTSPPSSPSDRSSSLADSLKTHSSSAAHPDKKTEALSSSNALHRDLRKIARNLGLSPSSVFQVPRLAEGAEGQYSDIRFFLDITDAPSASPTKLPASVSDLASASNLNDLAAPCQALRSLVSLMYADTRILGDVVGPIPILETGAPIGILDEWKWQVMNRSKQCKAVREKSHLSVLTTDRALDAVSRSTVIETQTQSSGSHLSVVLCTDDKRVIDSWKDPAIERVFVTQSYDLAAKSLSRAQQKEENGYSVHDWALETLIMPLMSEAEREELGKVPEESSDSVITKSIVKRMSTGLGKSGKWQM